MGKFEDSFKRQVGRDTGKFVSNVIFGDKHATPVRVSVRQEKLKLEKERFENERELERQRLRDRQQAEKKQLEIQQEHLQKERIYQIRMEMMEKIEALAGFELPSAVEELTKVLKGWDIQLHAYSFSSDEEGKKFITQYMNALKCKYQQGIQKLAALGLTEKELEPYRKTVGNYQRRRLWSKISVPVYIVCALFVIFFILAITD